MKRFIYILLVAVFALVFASCTREEEPFERETYPDGTPLTLCIPFGAQDATSVDIRTKVEATEDDECRVHDLYVLIFDSEGDKFYGRFFTHEHLSSTLSDLGNNANEGWYVDDNTLHKGVVKLATEARTGCTLVVVANVDNSITYLDDELPIDRLSEITTLDEFKSLRVVLEQDVVNRKDLFLMLGSLENLSTSEMVWYSGGAPDYDSPNYNPDYKVSLERVDAKVQFRIKTNETYISAIETRYWQVFNVPSSCYLYPSDSDTNGDERYYFDTDQVFFETQETDSDGTWQVFTFYMMENRPQMKKSAQNYYQREKQIKTPIEEGSSAVINGDWEYAPDEGTYVKFDVILTLTEAGIEQLVGDSSGDALTTDAIFTVHLGDFGSSTDGSYDNYSTLRNHSYTYDITLNNSRSIYVEVTDDDRTNEPEAGHEGSLLFAKDTIIVCDAHYNYYTLSFKRDETLKSNKSKISWYVKTPFCEGGASWNDDAEDWVIDPNVIDYDWVKFSANTIVDGEYTNVRVGYPGEDEYDPSWYPGKEGDKPALMNVQQLIQYIFYETEKKESESDFKSGVIKLTAFVDEFYYEKDPSTGSFDANLWREFVNASPREMHILSKAAISADGQSDIVNSSHSIIQRSIQTIYNISSPYLNSAWGTEHIDEMRNRGELEEGFSVHCGWPWSTDKAALTDDDSYCNDINNGRFNTAGLWRVNPDGNQEWSKYLKYNVHNTVPELRDGTDGGDNSTNYRLMAYSCLTRNRDNNGNGIIDLDEVRWYLASQNQVIGLWVGTEALSPSARIYQPLDASSTNPYEWRAHVVTSTCSDNGSNPMVIVAEEGTSTYKYYTGDVYGNDSWNVFATTLEESKNKSVHYAEKEWNKIQSVRCVRNVGSFSDNGITRDISYAPLTVQPDQYYDSSAGFDQNGFLLPNNDGTYTLRFDNLNTKSIREYTAIDLPYHDEYSYHNRVYLELNMQDPEAFDFGSTKYKMLTLNDDITKKGYNPYCPDGYRFPNMTELSVMKGLLPSSYWNDDSGRNTARPSRTYFTKGYLGSKIPSESEKIGWVYSVNSAYLNLTEYNNVCIDAVRCVRDNNMTGDISGKLQLSCNKLYVSDQTEINFNFTSTASAITDASLSLCYEDGDGNNKELSIPVDDLELYGLTLRGSYTYTIPADLPVRGSMYFRATIKNSAGQVESFDAPLKVLSNIDASITLQPYEYSTDGDRTVFPVLLNAFCEDGAELSNWTLRVQTPDDHIYTYAVDPCSTSSWSTVYSYNFGSYEDLQIGTYVFQLSVEDSGGISVNSDKVSMDIIMKDTQADGEAWVLTSSGSLDADDFIEAKMDVSGSASNYRENLISFGLKIDGEFNKTNAFHLYYPENSGNNKMMFHPVAGSGSIGTFTPYLTPDGTTSTTPSDKMLVVLMDHDGMFWNGLDFCNYASSSYDQSKYDSLLESLCSASTLHIGSLEGSNRSHADYKYVRVVHNGSLGENSVHWDGSFEEDPVYGGDL